MRDIDRQDPPEPHHGPVPAGGTITDVAGDGTAPPQLRLASARGRWVIAATVLGSGMAFLDGTIVNVALPSISEDFDTSFSSLQWTMNAYMVTLTALLLFGGNLGDRLGRRKVFVWGLVAFTGASIICGLAPDVLFLNVARAVQGVGAALMIPGSLAIIGSVFHPDDRGRAIGTWSGLSGVSTSIGPFVGGWLIDTASWRAAFFLNVVLAVPTLWIALRHVPDTRSPRAGRLDVPGVVLATIGLAGISYYAIEHSGAAAVASGVVGLVAMIAFVVFEIRSDEPMLPMSLFRSRQFSGTNVATLAIYAGLSGAMFLVVIQLQVSLGYSALAAGAAMVPFSVIMLIGSPSAGQLGSKLGPRIPLTVGPLIAALGFMMLGGISPGDSYLRDVLPGVVVFGIGMTIVVAPLTTAVLDSVSDSLTGIASGINNAVSRLAGLLAVAALPGLAGIAADSTSLVDDLASGYATAVRLAAAVTALGGVLALVLVRRECTPFEPDTPASDEILPGSPAPA